MKKLKNYFNDPTLTRLSFYILLNAAVVTAVYYTVKNFQTVLLATGSFINSAISVLTPIIIGLLLAYFINPIVKIFNRHLNPENKLIKTTKRSRSISILLTYLTIVIALILIIYGIIVLLTGNLVVGNIYKLAQESYHLFVNYEADVTSWLSRLNNLPFSDSIDSVLDSLGSWFGSNFKPSAIATNLITTAGTIVNFVIGLIISIYLLIEKEYFKKMWDTLLALLFSDNVSNGINGILNDINGVISRFLRGMLLDALIVAILSSVSLKISGLEFAVFIGIFAGVANIIPYFGPILGMIPAFFIGWITDNVWQGLIAVIILLAIQQIDGNFIYPKIVGSQTGLRPVIVLITVSVMGGVFGIIGMILAVPTAGILQLFFHKWAKRRALKLNIELDKEIVKP